MTIPTGFRISHYEIVGSLGAGGMGEVYRARDTRLEREVAVKTLPAPLSSDPDRLRRFIREAKVLASLNHPNIGAIYGLEELPSGERFLILELIQGETLAERLNRGALAVPEALRVCGAITEAFEAAHERGVIHRDLKPGNVMLASSGIVKVLDFGLARQVSLPAGAEAVGFGTVSQQLAESLTLLREVGDKDASAAALGVCAQLAMALGEAERAACLYGASEALQESIGSGRSVANQEIWDANLVRIRSELGEDRFVQCLAEGRALSFEAAVKSALEWLEGRDATDAAEPA